MLPAVLRFVMTALSTKSMSAPSECQTDDGSLRHYRKWSVEWQSILLPKIEDYDSVTVFAESASTRIEARTLALLPTWTYGVEP